MAITARSNDAATSFQLPHGKYLVNHKAGGVKHRGINLEGVLNIACKMFLWKMVRLCVNIMISHMCCSLCSGTRNTYDISFAYAGISSTRRASDVSGEESSASIWVVVSLVLRPTSEPTSRAEVATKSVFSMRAPHVDKQ